MNMEKEKYAAILPILIGGLANKIIEETGSDENEVFEKLYGSELYAVLENEATKVWTYSIPMLYDLYRAELTNGKLELPEY